MPLFKYLKQEYLDSFFSRGAVRIGSLYEYRNVEQYGGVIGDVEEGVHETVLDKIGKYEIDMSGDSQEAMFFKERFDIADTRFKIIMSDGAEVISRSQSPDYFIYCVTTEFNRDSMESFGCDACIEITRPDLFFHAISKKIRHKAKFEGGAPITYGDKTTSYSKPHSVHPARMKGKEYEYQKEFRGIWTPNKEIKSPLYINVPKAIKACRIYKFK